MKKGEIYEGTVLKTVFPNKGILEAEGKKVTVKDAIPGQRISFRIKKVRKDAAEGLLLDVLERSPLETDPKCPHFPDCGGCAYQNLTYEEQIRLKEEQLKSILNAAVKGSYKFEGVKPSPQKEEFRNKMEFTFGDEYKDGPLSLGMHKRGSHYDIISTTGCRITDEDYRKILGATLEYFKETGLPYYHRTRHEGYLRHLLVRKASETGEILVSLITASRMNPDLSPWVNRLLALETDGHFAGILHTLNDSPADAVHNDRTEILYGQDYFYEELSGLRFKISPFSFFQTNSRGAEVLYSIVREYIGDTKDRVIFDLYSGTGTIAQMLAPVAERVIGVEIVEEAVEAARANAALNGLTNCEFIAGDVLKVLDGLKYRPDLIVLDPPRDGVNPKALRKIIDYGVERIVYISCKPTSLARDLEMLQGCGYRVEKCAGVDMFPFSANIETVCLLGKRKPDTTVRIGIDMEDYYRIREAEKTAEKPL